MIKYLKRLIYGRDLQEVLIEEKRVKIQGIKFIIKRLDVVSVLDGSKVLLSSYQTYEDSKAQNKQKEKLESVVKDHYRDVFLSSVVYPKLRRELKEGDDKAEGLFVDYLFTDFSLADDLYKHIIEFTYGKKKLKAMGLKI